MNYFKKASLLLVLFVLGLFVTEKSFAFSLHKNVVDRDSRFRAKIMSRELKNLTSKNSYEGEFFKIVLGKSDRAISFDAPEKLQLKAATTYYHLTKAREYFVNHLHSKHVSSLGQLVIRLDISNQFNELGHFAHDNLDPEFNNALSIPAGHGFSSRGIKPWSNEIWFRPAKRVHISEFSGGVDEQEQLLKNSLSNYRRQTHMITLQRFMADVILGSVVLSNQTPIQNVMRLSGTSLFIELIYHSTSIAANFFTRKWYSLDSALVPEIIYHEFSHVALSDYLEITHSTPINEGMADYFAGKIANSDELATHIRDYNLFSGKKVDTKKLYRQEFERSDFANTDFVFGLLWQSEQALGENADAFIFDLRKEVDAYGTIRSELVDAYVKTCHKRCKNPFLTRLKLLKLFHYKGL